MGVVIAILVLGLVIFTHELGHFLFAKVAGVKVNAFYLGMGPKLLHKTWRGTEYSLRLLPIGGACELEDEGGMDGNPDGFGSKPWTARFWVIFGGPFFNFLTAWILAVVLVCNLGANVPQAYALESGHPVNSSGISAGDRIISINGDKIKTGHDFAMWELSNRLEPGDTVRVVYKHDGGAFETSYAVDYDTYRLGISYMNEGIAKLTYVVEGGGADMAGVKAGDVVVGINGMPLSSGAEMRDYMAGLTLDGSPVGMTVERDGERLDFVIVPQRVSGVSLGFNGSSSRSEVGGFDVFLWSVQEVGGWMRSTLGSVKLLATGRLGLSDLSGPVGVVSTVSDVVSVQESAYDVLMNVVNIIVLLSANIGLMNLLPLPALDGGRLAFIIVEAVRGKKIKPEIENRIHGYGFAALMVLMGVIMFSDGLKILFGA